MHYRHSYHAGNFADVFKHVVLCGLLAALNRKDKPWCYLETHSGAGLYDLGSAGALRTGEWREGIGRLDGVQDAAEPMASFLRIVRDVQAGSANSYPGSPLIAQALARPGDRLLLCERVPEIAEDLKQSLGRDPRTAIHRRDGYEAHSLLPPAEKRGLVLVDPPFERPDEFELAAEFLKRATQRFAAGIYAVWYPLKNRHAAGRFERRAAALGAEPPLRIEFDNGAKGEGQMRASAMLILNPPFRFEQDIVPALKTLVRELSQGPRAAYSAQSVQAS
jgi:23S rRNA (adenine2030-N6)-methyltransferase